jgi:hypothetical protein
LSKRAALIVRRKGNGLDDPSLATPGTTDMRRSGNQKMRGFYGLAGP